MEEYTQITIDEWMQWREDIRRKLSETAENFVYIGYRLKQIRDSGMLDGASDIFEFAQKEYGLGKSTVSRFIAINEKYSEGGNSLELREEYKNFSSSKLSEMLTLPDNECQLITEKTTIKEIREFKNFIKNEQTAEDEAAVPEQTAEEPETEGEETAAGLEQTKEDTEEAAEQPEIVENPGGREEIKYSDFQKCIIDFFKDKKSLLNTVMDLVGCDMEENYKKAAELICPSGTRSHQKGIIFLFMYDLNKGVKYKQLGIPKPIERTWKEFLDIIYDIYSPFLDAEKEIYESFYGEEEKSGNTEKTENKKARPAGENQGFAGSVATSQQNEKTEENDAETTEEFDRKMEKGEEKKEGSEEVCGDNIPDPVSAESEDGEDGEASTGSSETPASGDGKMEESAVNGTNLQKPEVNGEEIDDSEEKNDDFKENRSESGNMEAVEPNSEDTDEEHDDTAAVDPDKENCERYRSRANSLAKEVREDLSFTIRCVNVAENIREWQNARAKLITAAKNIEQIIRFLDMVEDED